MGHHSPTIEGTSVFAHNQGLVQSPTTVRVESLASFEHLDDVRRANVDNNLLSFPLYVSLKIYFENGGGPCYVCPTSNLAEEVSKLDDVTLIVAAGEDLIDGTDLFVEGGLCSATGRCFAILDGPSKLGSDPVKTMASYPTTPNAAAYFPNLKLTKDHNVIAPVSAAVAGLYHSVEIGHGIWGPPANIPLKGGVEAEVQVSDETLRSYRGVKPLNMVVLTDRGPVVLGMYTLVGDDNAISHYVPAQRLYISVENHVRNIIRTANFESDSTPTWASIQAEIHTYLEDLWRKGALNGDNNSQAYSLQVDGDAEGNKVVRVGIAPITPGQFIYFELTQRAL
ncbi:hypothetical protein BGZ46_008771 [Entomortierella lignicola]|nr:hypothetical protein BGZ46_008771 [Entomortierella lignicola]